MADQNYLNAQAQRSFALFSSNRSRCALENSSRHLPLAIVLALASSLVTATRPVALSRPTIFVPAPSCVAAAQQGGPEAAPAPDADALPLSVRYGILFRRIAGPQPGRQEAKVPGDTAGPRY